jgi:hypothetical protein
MADMVLNNIVQLLHVPYAILKTAAGAGANGHVCVMPKSEKCKTVCRISASVVVIICKN